MKRAQTRTAPQPLNPAPAPHAPPPAPATQGPAAGSGELLRPAPAGAGQFLWAPPGKVRGLGEKLLSAMTVRSNRRVLGLIPNGKRIDGPASLKWRAGPVAGSVSANLHRQDDAQKFAWVRSATAASAAPAPASDEQFARFALSRLKDRLLRELAQLDGVSAAPALPRNPVPVSQQQFIGRHAAAFDRAASSGLGQELLRLRQAQRLSDMAQHWKRQADALTAPPPPVAAEPDVAALAQSRVAALEAECVKAAQEQARQEIAQCKGLELRQALTAMHDEAVLREAGRAGRDVQLPLHELQVAMHALRSVTDDASGRALALQGLRGQTIAELMTEPDSGAPAQPWSRPHIRQALAALADLPRGADVLQAIAKAETHTPDGEAQRAYRLEALQVYLRAEKIRAGELRSGPGSMAATLTEIQASALQRYRFPPPASAAPLGARQLSDYNMLRNGLIGPDGDLLAMDRAAEALAAFHRRLSAQATQASSPPPAIPLPAAAEPQRTPMLARLRRLVGTKRPVAKAINRYVPLPAPVSVVNPASLAAFNLVSTAYSPDPTLRTGIRLDSHLTQLQQALVTPTIAHVAALADGPLPDPLRDSCIGMLASLALEQLALQGIEQAAGRGRIRPEHAQLEQVADAHFKQSELHASLSGLCRDAGLAGAGPLTPQFERAMLDQCRIAYDKVDGAPLRQEHLLARLNALQAAAPAGAVPGEAAALGEAATLGAQIAAFRPAPASTEVSYDTLRDTLHRFIRQAEVRNKFRLTSVAARELNMRPLAAAMPELLADAAHAHAVAGIGFRVRAEAGAGTGEYFEVSYSSAGLEVAFGTDERSSQAGGASFGVSGGYADGVFSAKGVAGGEYAKLRERTRHHGVRFTIPRSTSKAYTDEQARNGEYMDLIDSLFPQGGPAPAAAAAGTGTGAGAGHGHLRAVLEKCPHVSVNLIGVSYDDSDKTELGLSIGVQAKAAVVGAVGTVGWQMSQGQRQTGIAEASGSLGIDRVSSGSGRAHSSAAGAALGLAIGLGGKTAAQFGITPLASVNASKQFRARGNDHKFRFTVENGRTQAANTRNEMEFSRARDVLAYIDRHKEDILQLSMDRKFSKGYENATPLARRQLALADLKALKQTIAGFENDGKNLSLQNVFSVSACMTDAAALQNDVLRSARAMLEHRMRSAAQDEDAGLEAQLAQNWKEQDALLNAPASWKIWKIEGNERTSFQKEQTVDFVYKESIRIGADGQRALFSFPD